MPISASRENFFPMRSDELITIDHAQALYKKTNNKLDPVWIQDCGHNDILSRIDEDIWSSFINQN